MARTSLVVEQRLGVKAVRGRGRNLGLGLGLRRGLGLGLGGRLVLLRLGRPVLLLRRGGGGGRRGREAGGDRGGDRGRGGGCSLGGRGRGSSTRGRCSNSDLGCGLAGLLLTLELSLPVSIYGSYGTVTRLKDIDMNVGDIRNRA